MARAAWPSFSQLPVTPTRPAPSPLQLSVTTGVSQLTSHSALTGAGAPPPTSPNSRSKQAEAFPIRSSVPSHFLDEDVTAQYVDKLVAYTIARIGGRTAKVDDEREEGTRHQKRGQQGFEGATASAMLEMRTLVLQYLQAIYARAHAFAEHAARIKPGAPDLIAALDEQGVGVEELKTFCKEERMRRRKRKRVRGDGEGGKKETVWEQRLASVEIPFAMPPLPSSSTAGSSRVDPSTSFLPSGSSSEDSEADAPGEDDPSAPAATGRHTRVDAETERRRKAREARRKEKERRKERERMLRESMPSWAPRLPSKHAWRETPSYPLPLSSKLTPLSFLDLKLRNRRLVEGSLRNLIHATDLAASDVTPSSRSPTTAFLSFTPAPPLPPESDSLDHMDVASPEEETDKVGKTRQQKEGRISLRIGQPKPPSPASISPSPSLVKGGQLAFSNA